MQFRPCIDLRHGKVTQIVGSSLKSQSQPKKRARIEVSGNTKEDKNAVRQDETQTNFETDKSSAYYAKLYQQDGLTGGHVIMLGPGNEEAALSALAAYPHGLQVGGGINPENAKKYLDAGASHIIVTSYVFKNGKVNMEKLKELVDVVGKDRLVLDLSCRKKKQNKGADYFVVTDRWQKFTNQAVNKETMELLSQYCVEFLVHGVDVEGKKQGIEEELVEKLGKWSNIPVTYAGGVRSFDDLKLVQKLGQNKVNITVGSALNIFGGHMSYSDVVKFCNGEKNAPKKTNETPITVTTATETITPTVTTAATT